LSLSVAFDRSLPVPSSRHLVDAELSPLLDLFPATTLSDETLAEARARELPLPIDPAADAAVVSEWRRIQGPAGAPDIEIFHYRTRTASGVLPCILHIHGGGYVMGSARSMAPLYKPLVQKLGCTLVAVEYRLAPETRAPGAAEDCYAALTWLATHAGELGVDPAKHLIYPMLDDRTSGGESDIHPFAGEFIWTHHNNRFGWNSLLGVPAGANGVSPYASPARAESLAGLPPTFISTGALDLFVDEDVDYAQRLIRAGVPTELHVYPGAFHAFDFAPDADVARRARHDSLEALARALA
jgi:triacylglycerol lipase